MKIEIDTIPHVNQRYSTPGDWFESIANSRPAVEGGAVKTLLRHDGDISDSWPRTLHIKVSEELSPDEAFLVALHELVEVMLCKKRGITQKQVDEFDMQFEKDRDAGKHKLDEEPGDDPDAPYRKEHFFATNIERLVAAELGVDWEAYEDHIEALS